MNQVVVSADRETASIGPGNRWGDVSRALDPLGVAVVGGRIAEVGVSGLILGGGISYFSGRRGWACDNVRAFEVVLASGDVVTATPDEHPDLYWALRGGTGSSLGVVTRFDLVSFPQGNLWKRDVISSLTTASAELVPAFVDLVANGLPSDPDAHSILVFTDVEAWGDEVAVQNLVHATATDADATPAVLQRVAAVPGTIIDTTTVANVSVQMLASELYGARKSSYDVSFQCKEGAEDMLHRLIEAWRAHRQRIKAAVAEVGDPASLSFISLHPITVPTIEAMERNGGNALGLRSKDGPVITVSFLEHWSKPELDAEIRRLSLRIVDESHALAREFGLESKYIYVNYAGELQDFFSGYGEENRERLRSVVRTYDPEGLFRDLWKGYFKV